MLTVFDYQLIRSAHARGESIRSLARRLGDSEKTIRKVLASASGMPPPYLRRIPVFCPRLGDNFKTCIDQILTSDLQAPSKQRHTAMQIYRRLLAEQGYSGGYDQVRRYVQRHVHRQQETFVPLTHPPGVRLECDFGHIHVDYPDGRRMVSVLVAAWSFSQAIYLIKLPSEKTESILHGMTSAFEFFGCVPHELWWDNPKTVAVLIHRGRLRSLNIHYAALASHYRFEPLCCMPRKGQEKSDAERTVYSLQRRFGTPVPQVADDAQLNARLLAFCQQEMQRTVAGQSATIGENFARDKANALSLPVTAFDACITRPAVVDKYQTVRIDGCRYSLPRQCAFEPVVAKVYPERIVLVHRGQAVAEHARLTPSGSSSLDPLHYLPALIKKPGALDHAGVFSTWKLPPTFEALRHRLESIHGQLTGTRHYIRVLQLLINHPVARVQAAVDACGHGGFLTAEIIACKARMLSGTILSAENAGELAAVPDVHVGPVNLRRFNELLTHHPSAIGTTSSMA